MCQVTWSKRQQESSDRPCLPSGPQLPELSGDRRCAGLIPRENHRQCLLMKHGHANTDLVCSVLSSSLLTLRRSIAGHALFTWRKSGRRAKQEAAPADDIG